MVVENVPGARCSIGAERVALAVNFSLYPKLPYDPLKDFTPVAWVATVPKVLVLHPATQAASLKAFVACAKTNPGRLNFGSGGNGSAANLATE